MNRVTLLGNLTKDPETKTTTSNKCICTFTVATNNGKDKDGNDRPADYITCKAWEKRGETIAKYMRKGSKILVTGAFKTDTYTDTKHEDVTHYSSYVLVDGFEFAGGGSGGGSASNNNAAQPQAPADEEVPF